MTHNELEFIIQSLNANNLNYEHYLTSLTSDVDIAYIWGGQHAGKFEAVRDYFPCRYYLQKSNDGKYACIVLDMEMDLHVYTLGEHRGNGYLSKCLKEVVFPHLSLIRDSQRITVEHSKEPNLPLEVAKHLGFEEQENKFGEDIELRLDLSPFRDMEVEFKIDVISPEELNKMRLKVQSVKEIISSMKYYLMLHEEDESLVKYFDDSESKIRDCEIELNELRLQRLHK